MVLLMEVPGSAYRQHRFYILATPLVTLPGIEKPRYWKLNIGFPRRLFKSRRVLQNATAPKIEVLRADNPTNLETRVSKLETGYIRFLLWTVP